MALIVCEPPRWFVTSQIVAMVGRKPTAHESCDEFAKTIQLLRNPPYTPVPGHANFERGDVLYITGLTHRTELNGRLAIVADEKKVEQERVFVHLIECDLEASEVAKLQVRPLPFLPARLC